MGREVQSAECIEPQPAAEARFRHRPDRQRHIERLRRLDRHRRVGEGDLKNEKVGDRLALELGDCRAGRSRVEQEVARTDDAVAGPLQAGEHLSQHVAGKVDVEGRAAERKDADGPAHEAHISA